MIIPLTRRTLHYCLLAFLFIEGWGGLTAQAHDHGPGSWINNETLRDPVSGEWCCNLIDCREEKDNVESLPDGNYRIKDTGEVIPYQRVIWRSPGSWWRCRYLDGSNKTRCLIGPPPGS